jgi:hypothetical protein
MRVLVVLAVLAVLVRMRRTPREKEAYDNDFLFAVHANTSNDNVATDLEV